jgi:tRNA-binding protein
MTPASIKPVVSLEVLNQIDIRVGTIIPVSDVPDSGKLVQLRVGFGDHERTIVAGMKTERANPPAIAGKQAPFVVNLEPRRMRASCRKACCPTLAMTTACVRCWRCRRIQCRMGPGRARTCASASTPTPWRISTKRTLRGRGAAAGLFVRRESPDEQNSYRGTSPAAAPRR